MQTLNRFFFEICKISAENYRESLDRPVQREEIMEQIQNNLTYSTEKSYEERIMQNESFISH